MKIKNQKSKGKSDEEQNEEVLLLKSQLVRALADYDNLRKRIESERIGLKVEVESITVLKMLPVLDMLEDAQKHLKDSGLAIVIGEFKRSLNELGVEEINAKSGDDFNPLEQEAVEVVFGGEENKVSEVTKTGWKIRGQAFIIRPAMVKVFGKK